MRKKQCKWKVDKCGLEANKSIKKKGASQKAIWTASTSRADEFKHKRYYENIRTLTRTSKVTDQETYHAGGMDG
jgi:hypothetical protein